MNHISFAWTLTPLLNNAKTCTRRDWLPAYARKFRKFDTVLAYDRQPRYGGKPRAVITLTADPTLEPLEKMPEEDYEAEGYAWLYDHPEMLPKTIHGHPACRADFTRQAFDTWRHAGRSMWVVRFNLKGIMQPDISDRNQRRLF